MNKYLVGKPLLKDVREISCAGKQRFDSFSQAQRFGAKRKGFGGGAFHCRACNGFHVGQVWHKGVNKKRPRIEYMEEEVD